MIFKTVIQLRHSTSIIVFLYALAFGELGFRITGLEGTAKILRSGKQEWEELTEGDAIRTNDMIETFFQSRAIIGFGEYNYAMLGSNTRALFAFSQSDSQRVVTLDITIHSGGLLVKSVSHSPVSLVSSNAVAGIDSGVVSAVVDARSSHTGFQVLGGRVSVRSLSFPDTAECTAGHATIIAPNQRPAPPENLTPKHAVVLKQFFGPAFIQKEIDASGIIFSADSVSATAPPPDTTRAAPDSAGDVTGGQTFTYSDLYAKIFEPLRGASRRYQFSTPPRLIVDGRFNAGASASCAFVNHTYFPVITQVLAMHFPVVKIGLRFAVAQDYDGELLFNMDRAEGLADKIDYFFLGSPDDSLYAALWPIRGLTMGTGLVVRDFSNANPYSAMNIVGMTGRIKRRKVDLTAFITDITSFTMGGVHLTVEPGVYSFGAGYYFDANHYKRFSVEKVQRFIKQPSASSITDTGRERTNAYIYELDGGFDIVDNYRLRLHVLAEFAHKLSAEGSDGIAIKAPGLVAEWAWMKAGAGYLMEFGRMIAGQFHPFYMTNRNRVLDGTTYRSQNTLLSTSRRAHSFYIDAGASPVPGSSINLYWRQGFYSRNTFTDVSTGSGKNDFDITLSFAVEQGFLPFIRYADIYAGQIHGGYFPADGRLLQSWGVESGVRVFTLPLWRGICCESGFKVFYLDLDPDSAPRDRFNMTVDSDDLVVEGYFGIRWGTQ